MKKLKYIILAVILLITAGLLIKVLLPKRDKEETKTAFRNSLPVKDSTPVKELSREPLAYEIKNCKPITQANFYAVPVWSPNGKMIAVTNLDFKGIQIIDPETGTMKTVTEDEGSGFRYSWSPDSRQIVYLSRNIKDGISKNCIKVVDVTSGKIGELTAEGIGASMPSFTKSNGIMYSFKGSLILRNRISNNKKNDYTGHEVIADNVPANIIIQDPAGKKLIVEDNEGIKIMDRNGQNKKTIVTNGKTDFATNSMVSPLGNKVLFGNTVATVAHLFVYDIGSEQVTDLGEGNFGQWLPDGRVVCCITKDNGYVTTEANIYLVNSDGLHKQKVEGTQGQVAIQPSVSPDGKTITYRDDKSGKIFLGILSKN